MRVLQATKAYYPHLGGVETVVQQVAEGLAARHAVDSHVLVCADGMRGGGEELNAVGIQRTATLVRVASLPLSPGFPLALLRNSADVLHIHEPFLVGPTAYLTLRPLAQRRYRKLVVWWHSDIIRQRSVARFYTPLLHALLRRADAITVATPKHVTSSTFLPRYADKCRVVHYGVDVSRFAPTDELRARADAIRAHYGKPIVLFTGRLVYYKGVEYLVQAMQRVPGAQLLIVGNGPLRADLEQMAAGGLGNVAFLPPAPEREFAALFHACDVFVLPSVEASEGFGIVQLEAMACGKPVITSDLPTGVTYVNQHELTGLVTPARDAQALALAIQRLLGDAALRQRLGAAAQARVEREFTVDSMVDRVAAVYREVLTAS